MGRTILTPEEIIKILKGKGYSAKIHERDKTIIVIDKDNDGNYFFSGEKLKELIKFLNESEPG